MKLLISILVSSISLINGRLLDKLTPCPINDGDCQKVLFQHAMQYVANGDEDLNIPPIDPLVVKDIKVSILNVVDIHLVEGLVKGLKDCKFEQVRTSIERRHSTMDIKCDVIVIKGHYTAKAKGTLLKNILGGQTISADGNAKISVENIRITIQLPFHAIRREDGEILLQCRNPNKTFDYTYELGDKAHFNIDNVYLGKQDISPLVTSILNENWQIIMETFGQVFIDKAMDMAYIHAHKFFDFVPAKYYISDNLEDYVETSDIE